MQALIQQHYDMQDKVKQIKEDVKKLKESNVEMEVRK